jgi:phosphate transport system permease protein
MAREGEEPMTPAQLQDYLNISYRARRWRDRFMRLVLLSAAILALTPLFSVLLYVISKGLPGLDLSFFTQIPKPVGEPGGGMANALIGTCTLVGIASVVGIPWCVAAGVYLSEYGRSRIASVVRFATDMLGSVPSIVIGLFMYAFLVVPMGGFSAIAGGVALGVIMIPTVARSTEEMLKLVPTHIREAGLALGLPRWKVILRIVLRGCVSAITTGVMLAIARVAGETAPLLFTALNNRYWAQGLTEPIASLPVQIYSYAISPFEQWHTQAWAGALLLVLLVFAMNIGARVFFRGDAIGRE